MTKPLLSSPTIQYCESPMSGLIKRPEYALSNLPYLILGGYFLSKKNELSSKFGLITIFIGVFSFLYDSFPVYLTQLLDLFMMFVFATFLLSLVIKKSKPLWFLPLLGIVATYAFQGFAGNFVFGSMILTYIFIELRNSSKQGSHFKYWLIAFSIFASGFLFWLTDGVLSWCPSSILLSGRAIFHYTTVASIFFLHKYYTLQHS